MFDLECGTYQHTIIKESIKHQRIAQEQVWKKAQATRPSLNIADVVPPSTPVASGKLICTYDKKHKPVFYFHVHLTKHQAAREAVPRTVLAVCTYDGIYTYAVLDFDGHVLKVEDVPIPRHVDQRYGARRSDNSIYEVANSIVHLAWLWNAWIGMEETSSKKHRSFSLTANRRFLFIPTQTLITTVDDKAHMSGMMPVRRIINISSRDCPQCKVRLPIGTRVNIRYFVGMCPHCQHRQRILPEDKLYECVRCTHTYTKVQTRIHVEHEQACPKCYNHPILTRRALAVVAAQRMLNDIVDHWRYSLAKRNAQKR